MQVLLPHPLEAHSAIYQKKMQVDEDDRRPASSAPVGRQPNGAPTVAIEEVTTPEEGEEEGEEASVRRAERLEEVRQRDKERLRELRKKQKEALLNARLQQNQLVEAAEVRTDTSPAHQGPPLCFGLGRG